MEEHMNDNAMRERVVIESAPAAEAVSPTDKKHGNFAKIIAIVLFVVVLALAGFIVWHFLTAEHGGKECEAPKDDDQTAVDDGTDDDNLELDEEEGGARGGDEGVRSGAKLGR